MNCVWVDAMFGFTRSYILVYFFLVSAYCYLLQLFVINDIELIIVSEYLKANTVRVNLIMRRWIINDVIIL